MVRRTTTHLEDVPPSERRMPYTHLLAKGEERSDRNRLNMHTKRSIEPSRVQHTMRPLIQLRCNDPLHARIQAPVERTCSGTVMLHNLDASQSIARASSTGHSMRAASRGVSLVFAGRACLQREVIRSKESPLARAAAACARRRRPPRGLWCRHAVASPGVECVRINMFDRIIPSYPYYRNHLAFVCRSHVTAFCKENGKFTSHFHSK